MGALLDDLVAWHCREGGAFEDVDRRVVRDRLGFLLGTGRWLSARDDGGRVQGWLAWVETDARGLALLRTHDLDQLVQSGLTFQIFGGPHVYVMDLIVAPGADRRLYRRLLYRDLPRRVPQAVSISGHMVRPDGRRTFHIRRPDGGRYEALMGVAA